MRQSGAGGSEAFPCNAGVHNVEAVRCKQWLAGGSVDSVQGAVASMPRRGRWRRVRAGSGGVGIDAVQAAWEASPCRGRLDSVGGDVDAVQRRGRRVPAGGGGGGECGESVHAAAAAKEASPCRWRQRVRADVGGDYALRGVGRGQ